MKIFWKSIRDEASNWLGDEIKVRDFYGQPHLYLESCTQNTFTLRYKKTPLFWARQHNYHYGVALLKTFENFSALSPISSFEVEKRKELSPKQRLESWSKYFINDLKKHQGILLYNGSWLMTAYISHKQNWHYESLEKNTLLSAHILGLECSLEPTPFQQIPWFIGKERVINLKIVEPQSGRLKWWRKKAIEDALPPILLLYISGLDNYIILDGHSRLQAAYDQKVVPDVLILSPATKDSFTWSNETEKQAILREVDANKHLTQEKINELHIKAHTNSQLFYNTRIKATQNKSKEDCIKEVAKYLYSLDSLEKIEEFFYGEWKE